MNDNLQKYDFQILPPFSVTCSERPLKKAYVWKFLFGVTVKLLPPAALFAVGNMLTAGFWQVAIVARKMELKSDFDVSHLKYMVSGPGIRLFLLLTHIPTGHMSGTTFLMWRRIYRFLPFNFNGVKRTTKKKPKKYHDLARNFLKHCFSFRTAHNCTRTNRKKSHTHSKFIMMISFSLSSHSFVHSRSREPTDHLWWEVSFCILLTNAELKTKQKKYRL